jgi:hypothetical protein
VTAELTKQEQYDALLDAICAAPADTDDLARDILAELHGHGFSVVQSMRDGQSGV